MRKKKSLQEITFVALLLVSIILLFHWYTQQNRSRMEERNKTYAEDSARLMSVQIEKDLEHA